MAPYALVGAIAIPFLIWLYTVVQTPRFHITDGGEVFGGSIRIEVGYEAPFFNSPGVQKPIARVQAVRKGTYQIFPADTYDIKISVGHSLTEPQVFRGFKTDDESSRILTVIDYEWAQGTLAYEKNWLPPFVRFDVTRRSDGGAGWTIVALDPLHHQRMK